MYLSEIDEIINQAQEIDLNEQDESLVVGKPLVS